MKRKQNLLPRRKLRLKKNPQTVQWESLPNSQLYFDVEAWHRPDQKRNLCDVIARFVQKGKEVLVDGQLITDEWEDKNGGGKRSKIKLVVDTLELLGGPPEAGGKDGGDFGEQSNHGGRQAPPQQSGYGQQGTGFGDPNDMPPF